MQNSEQVEVQCIIRLPNASGFTEPIQLKITLSLLQEAESSEIPSTPTESSSPLTPFVHPHTTKLSRENWQGLQNLSYWSRGYRGAKVYLVNQALAQFLAQREESQWAIPENDE